MSVSVIYELATPFAEADLWKLRFEQAADLMVITRMGMTINRLRRFGHSNWILDSAPIGPTVSAPASTSVTVVNPKVGDSDYIGSQKNYVVTSISPDGQESVPSPMASGINDLNLKGDFNIVNWGAVAGITSFKVYEARDGMYGYLGSARNTTSFKDDNILANFSDSPPERYNPFATESPDIASFYESRLWAGRLITKPNALFASRTDDIFNFDKSSPLRATDSIALALRSRRQNAIRHIVPMKDLIVLTGDMMWSLRSTSDGVLSPSTIKATPEGYRGCGLAKPEVVGELFFYTTTRGDSIRTGGYTFERDGYVGNNICVFANHLFDNHEVLEMAWAETPSSVLWARRNDGKLAALTWMQEQDIWGWSLHDTDGSVESICVVPEQGRDALYAVVNREVNSGRVRYVERLSEPSWIKEGWSDLAGAICLDSSDYLESETPFNVLTRIGWLEGRDVVVLGDGVVYKGHRIENGTLVPELPNLVTRAVIGLPYTARVQTLKLAAQTQSGPTKGSGANISKVFVDVINTSGFGDGLLCGANLEMDEEPVYALDPPEFVLTVTPPAPYTGMLSQEVGPGDWGEASIAIWQTDPLPMVVTGIHFDVDFQR